MRTTVLGSVLVVALAMMPAGCAHTLTHPTPVSRPSDNQPYVMVLGTAQDAGSPQINSPADHPARVDPSQRRLATSLGVVDPRSGQRWLIEATPDMRTQAWALSRADPESSEPIGIDGVFVTHAHIGHYTGLMFFGHESMGARGVPVHAMPLMQAYLKQNGPWDMLVQRGNIELRPLRADEPVVLGEGLSITPFLVPHRREYSETVGFRIDGPSRSVLFIPDIDSWDQWASGDDGSEPSRIIDAVAAVDAAYLDATFHDNNELPGRDMSGFPHPRIVETMNLMRDQPASERAKIRFIHLNHTNPAQWRGSRERRTIEDAGFGVAVRGERVGL